MAQSTTTFLQLIQEVLLNVGERPVTSYQNMSDTDPRKFAARKAYSGLKEALLQVQAASDWGFLKTYAEFDTDDWVDDVLTIVDTSFNRVLGATFQSPNGYGHELQYVTRSEFDTMRHSSGRPLYYCPLDVEEGTIMFNPAPETDEDKLAIKVQVTANLDVLDGNDATPLPVPERFIPYLRLYTEGFLLENHVGDITAAQVKYRTAEGTMFRLTTRYQNVSSGHRTMYRGRRNV